MRNILLVAALAVCVVCDGATAATAAQTEGVLAGAAGDTRFDFGTVLQGAVIEHAFPLRNEGAGPLRIAGVQLSPPLQLGRTPAVIAPGATGQLRLRLDTSAIEGDFSGELLVTLDDRTATPLAFALAGKVVPRVEILPRPAFFLSTSKGVAKSASVEIVNHDSEPLALALPTPPPAHYTARLQTVEAGRRYRLTVGIPAGAPAGRRSDRLELQSSSARTPVIPVGVNTLVRARVHTFPDVVDFGQLRLSELRDPGAAAFASQTLMVYQTGGRDFSLTGHSSVPGLAMHIERGPRRDRVQITASLLRDEVAPGPLHGTIHVRTNDPEFPELAVPVTGAIVAD